MPVTEEFQFNGHMLSPIRSSSSIIPSSSSKGVGATEGEDEPHFIRNKLALSARLTDTSMMRKGEGVELFDGLMGMELMMGMDIDGAGSTTTSLDPIKKRKGRGKQDDDKSNSKKKVSSSGGNSSSSKKKSSTNSIIESPISVADEADTTNDMTTPSAVALPYTQPNISPSGTSHHHHHP